MRSVLAVGTDVGAIVAGCGGTLAAHRAAGDKVTIFACRNESGDPVRALDCLFVQGKATIAAIENVITGIDADVIYAPAPDDALLDQRDIASATLSAGRHGTRVLHYAGASTLRFEPSVFVDVSAYLKRKLALIAEPEVAAASARHLGALARVRHAEAFQPTRFVWDL